MQILQIHSKKQKGFTLVELMISIVISSIIMLGVVSLYSSSRKGQKTNESLARIQENLRFAANMITKDTRMAGYAGCRSSSVTNVLEDTTGVYNFEQHITGWEGGVSAFPDTGPDKVFPTIGTSARDRVANTDAMAIIRVSSTGCKITSHNSNSATIFLNATACGIEADEVLSITDCSQTSIFRVTGPTTPDAHIVHNTGAVGDGPKNCSKNLGPNATPATGCAGTFTTYTYNEDARVHKYIMHAYYIGVSTSGQTKSLYIVDLDKGVTSATELVEGIEDFQITYGYDSDDDGFPERFIKANQITVAGNSAATKANWKKVVAVKFGMLLASINDVKSVAPATAKSFTLVDTSVAPGPDKKLRFAYNTTVKIRNKGIR